MSKSRKDFHNLSQRQQRNRLTRMLQNDINETLVLVNWVHNNSQNYVNRGVEDSEKLVLHNPGPIVNNITENSCVPSGVSKEISSLQNFRNNYSEENPSDYAVGSSESNYRDVDEYSNLSDSDFDSDGVSSDTDADGSESDDDFYNDLMIASESSAINTAAIEPPKFELKSFLVEWNFRNGITQRALTELLHGLKECGHSELPSDARSLLKTPRVNKIEELASGVYAHYGLKKALIDQLKYADLTVISTNIVLVLFIDGLSLSKSSKSELWPILGKIDDDEHFPKPFVIGIYHGVGKPDNCNVFLENSIHDYLDVKENGFDFQNYHYTVDLDKVIADTMARNYILNFPPHNCRCGKCIQRGKMVQRRCVFLQNDAPLRTDATFREDVPAKYKNLISPFEGIGISLVKQIPLDPMHLVHLGVVKRHTKIIINEISNGEDGKTNIDTLNSDYTDFKQWVPRDFNITTRSFANLKSMKAKELRMLILYTGPVIFCKYLSERQRLHFNSLSCAIRILSDEKECIRNNKYANDLLLFYVDEMKNLFGEFNLVFNVHNLIHLADDVLRFGPLDNFSAMVFESFLGIIKRLVKKGSCVLSQIMNRLNERSQASIKSRHNDLKSKARVSFSNEIQNCWLPDGYSNAYREIKFSNFVLTNTKPNNCCTLKDGSFILINHICYRDRKPVILGQKYLFCLPIENYPMDSRDLGLCKTQFFNGNLQEWSVKDIDKKVFRIFHDNYFYMIPLIHTHNS